MPQHPVPIKTNTQDSTWSNLLADDQVESFTGVGQTSLWPMLHAASRFDEDEDSDETDSTESSSANSQTGHKNRVRADFRDVEPASIDSSNNSFLHGLGQLSAVSYNFPVPSYLDTGAPKSTVTSPGPDPSLALKVIQAEFGVITKEGETEVLIKEADAALLLDTTILGAVHVTSHRVTFHASLLSNRLDSTPKGDNIIKSGSIVCPTGFHRKKRRWLELSHDMLSLYKDSSPESRTRPLRSILLSGVVKIHDHDSTDPTAISMVFDKEKGLMTVQFLFDTSEAAIDWRREIREAVFHYRQRRADHLYGDEQTSEARREAGVRTCVPIHRIESASSQEFLDVGKIVTFTISNEPSRETPEETQPPIPAVRDFKVLILGSRGGGSILPDLIRERKKQIAETPDVPLPPQANVITVDFGPLSFADFPEKGLAAPLKAGTQKNAGETREAALERKMRTIFALKRDAELFIHRAWLHGRICCSGYLVVSPEYICFWSKSYTGSDVQLRYPTKDLNEAKELPSTIFGHQSLGIEMKGHELVLFSFSGRQVRDTYIKRINSARVRALEQSPPPSHMTRTDSMARSEFGPSTPGSESQITSCDSGSEASNPQTPSGHDPLQCNILATQTLAPLSSVLAVAKSREITKDILALIPKPINIPRDMLPNMRSRHFVCLTIGSRGDVQPYIALCRGLIAEGHTATIVTHEEYKDWVVGFGVNHRTAGGDPAALMKLSVEHSMFSPQFFKESIGKFRGWLDDLLNDSWKQCQDADVLIESPSAMAGVHVAEALKIPYIRAFTMPWTRTTAYPHAFLSPPVELSGHFNYSTYVLFDNILWTAMSGQVNRWRKRVLQIPKTDLETLAQTKIPFIYNFSPAVVPKPLDWSDLITVSGYWFLDNPDLKWTPSPELLEFIAKAKQDGAPLVYIGFGSIVVPNPRAMTRSIYKGVLKAGVRAIVSKGWSDRLSKDKDAEPIPIPPECFPLDKVPHDWLFPQLDAALHHGGAGTTGASLRAGIPTLIKPWFGDQFFWASRVHKLGAGLRVDSLSSSELSSALIKATSDRIMKEKASAVGERIRTEDGVHNAIHAIYTYMERAANRRNTL